MTEEFDKLILIRTPYISKWQNENPSFGFITSKGHTTEFGLRRLKMTNAYREYLKKEMSYTYRKKFINFYVRATSKLSLTDKKSDRFFPYQSEYEYQETQFLDGIIAWLQLKEYCNTPILDDLIEELGYKFYQFDPDNYNQFTAFKQDCQKFINRIDDFDFSKNDKFRKDFCLNNFPNNPGLRDLFQNKFLKRSQSFDYSTPKLIYLIKLLNSINRQDLKNYVGDISKIKNLDQLQTQLKKIPIQKAKKIFIASLNSSNRKDFKETLKNSYYRPDKKLEDLLGQILAINIQYQKHADTNLKPILNGGINLKLIEPTFAIQNVYRDENFSWSAFFSHITSVLNQLNYEINFRKENKENIKKKSEFKSYKIVYQKNGLTIIRPLCWEANRIFASSAWCIFREKSWWNSHCSEYQFILINYNANSVIRNKLNVSMYCDSYDFTKVGFSKRKNNGKIYCFDNQNNSVSLGFLDEYLKYYGLSRDRIISMSKRVIVGSNKISWYGKIISWIRR
jgi:hypothetical protein